MQAFGAGFLQPGRGPCSGVRTVVVGSTRLKVTTNKREKSEKGRFKCLRGFKLGFEVGDCDCGLLNGSSVAFRHTNLDRLPHFGINMGSVTTFWHKYWIGYHDPVSTLVYAKYTESRRTTYSLRSRTELNFAENE
uniref:Uncharacterized protein n=1 Tax=Solanum tuberosum TaxID=4113 RepID=M1DGU0_SOLTU